MLNFPPRLCQNALLDDPRNRKLLENPYIVDFRGTLAGTMPETRQAP